ncbi:DNA adenine methylase [Candidatus Parcubacteria bacterium]|nr:MAG: DNA adenine methylase [Candidatus Parcubacteria bacterium]
MLKAPTAYQGGKARLAETIVKHLIEAATQTTHFYDLCCGSGAITIELLTQGISPNKITVCDAGPWGLFWKEVGSGKFDLTLFKEMLKELPSLSEIQSYMKQLAKRPSDTATTQTFLLLQAASFGSKPIWIENNQWKNCSFRSYWQPTPTSNRKSPVNPMMPLPNTLLKRVELLCNAARGITGLHTDIINVGPPKDSIVYIDPPYKGTTPYGHTVDVVSYATSLGVTCFVSEGIPLSTNSVCLSAPRAKGGINGKKKIAANQEWLSRFP